jgi:hypothetical protein
LPNLDGRRASSIPEGIAVLVFTRTDCPIANRYAPELARLHKMFHPSGVQFRLVYVDPMQSVEAARAHLNEYGVPFEGLLDAKHELVKMAGVKTTPEVAVYSSGRLVYRGRINNRYISAGKSRTAATVHDLEETLSKVLSGQPVAFRTEAAVGCFIEDLR